MGYEARCESRSESLDGTVRVGEGAVLLETDELIVRGPARLRVARADIAEVSAEGDLLAIRHRDGTLSLQLGAALVAKWRDKLAEAPKSRLAKMGIKQGVCVRVDRVADPALQAELRDANASIANGARRGTSADDCDVVLLGVETSADLARIGKAVERLPTGAALWVIHPKGARGVKDTDIFAHGAAAGLVATKVARYSDTHTAEKLVRRRAP